VSGEKGNRVGINTMHYTEPQIRRILHVGFKTARQRGKRLCSVDKMNVLETTQLWRDIAMEMPPSTRMSSFRICSWITAPCNWCATHGNST
jgi:3-isopropylmalate dehydrogenase